MEVELDGTDTQQQLSPQLHRCSHRTHSKESPEQQLDPNRICRTLDTVELEVAPPIQVPPGCPKETRCKKSDSGRVVIPHS
jgi:hypothetical protein